MWVLALLSSLVAKRPQRCKLVNIWSKNHCGTKSFSWSKYVGVRWSLFTFCILTQPSRYCPIVEHILHTCGIVVKSLDSRDNSSVKRNQTGKDALDFGRDQRKQTKGRSVVWTCPKRFETAFESPSYKLNVILMRSQQVTYCWKKKFYIYTPIRI